MLASLLYPYDDDAKKAIERWLLELNNEGCITQYAVGDDHYIQINNWAQHQKIDHPSKSKIPAFDGNSLSFAKPREASINLAWDQGVDQGVDQGEDCDGFASFWSAYPKKTAKPAAQKAFRSAKINGHLPDVLADIERKASSDDWLKNGGQFVPNPATYLNQRRWEDQPVQQVSVGILPGAI